METENIKNIFISMYSYACSVSAEWVFQDKSCFAT
nr:MAG TPA: hypothetical protein [Caudoviricetes sp.]